MDDVGPGAGPVGGAATDEEVVAVVGGWDAGCPQQPASTPMVNATMMALGTSTS